MCLWPATADLCELSHPRHGEISKELHGKEDLFSSEIRNAERSGKLSEAKGTHMGNRGRIIGMFLEQARLEEKA